MPLKDMRIMGAHFNVSDIYFIALLRGKACLIMNQKEIITSISFYKNKCLIISYYNEQHLFIYPVFSNFCIICSYYSNERLVMFLPNIYPDLL